MKELFFRLTLSNASGQTSIDFPWNVLMYQSTREFIFDARWADKINGEHNDTTTELTLIRGAEYPPAGEGHVGYTFRSEEVRVFIQNWFDK